MARYRDGDSAAFDALYARHRTPLYRFLMASCRDPELAGELFQNTWAGVVRARDRYQPTAAFQTWLFSIGRNQLIDHARRQRGGLVSIDAEAVELPADPAATPDESLMARERGLRLLQAVAALPTVQREAFLLKEDGELSLEQIAELTGTGRETVKSRLRYAVAKLREVLADVRH